MEMFEKVKIKLINGKSRQFRLFGLPIFQYDMIASDDGKKKVRIYLPFVQSKKVETSSKPVFYLKINRDDSYAPPCLQNWIDIVNALNADFFIICDKKDLELKVLREVEFRNADIKIMKSYEKPLKKIVKNIASPSWVKAAYAHLTTFFHAKQNNIESFWNIDADDTMFLIKPSVTADIIMAVEKYANEHDISTFSLDMWRSKTRAKQWSFGITYTRQNIDYFKIFSENKNTDWQNHYKSQVNKFNIDLFFTFLRDHRKLNIESFYIENCHFLHSGTVLQNIITSGICVWKNGNIFYPIILSVFGDEDAGIIPIAKDCIKFDLNIKEADCFNFTMYNMSGCKDLSEKNQTLYSLEKVVEKIDTYRKTL